MDIIKLKRATKSVANTSTKVLEKDEVLVITPDSGSGKGKCQLKFGDGVTAIKSLPIAIDGENADEMKVPTITTASDENPVLSAGETIKVFFGKIKKKFTYLENLLGNVKTVTNLFGSNDAKTVAQGLQNLVNTKFNKSDLYDGTDSTSTSLGATANALRKVNEKTDNNTSSISTLNSNFDNLETALNSVLKTQWTSNSNEITVGPGSTVTAQFPTARIAGFVPIGIVGFSVKDGLTVYQCNTDTTNYTTNVYVRNDTASNIINTSGQISALVLYAKTFK